MLGKFVEMSTCQTVGFGGKLREASAEDSWLKLAQSVTVAVGLAAAMDICRS